MRLGRDPSGRRGWRESWARALRGLEAREHRQAALLRGIPLAYEIQPPAGSGWRPPCPARSRRLKVSRWRGEGEGGVHSSVAHPGLQVGVRAPPFLLCVLGVSSIALNVDTWRQWMLTSVPAQNRCGGALLRGLRSSQQGCHCGTEVIAFGGVRRWRLERPRGASRGGFWAVGLWRHWGRFLVPRCPATSRRPRHLAGNGLQLSSPVSPGPALSSVGSALWGPSSLTHYIYSCSLEAPGWGWGDAEVGGAAMEGAPHGTHCQASRRRARGWV